MHKQPVLLRRTGSSLPAGPGSASTGGTGGTGGQVVDPAAAIPVADSAPGLDPAAQRRRDSHKRKQSGIPLDADAILRRAATPRMSLEEITDEGSEAERSGDEEAPPSGTPTPLPEFADWSPGGDGARSCRQRATAVLTARGAAGALLAALALVFVAARSAAPAVAPAAMPAGAAGGAPPAQGAPGAKTTTSGEAHSAVVGAPMEHHVHEYNNVRYFDHPDIMAPLRSKGPVPWDDAVGGLHLFENVCLTTNVDGPRHRPVPDTGLRGLVYFGGDADADTRGAGNPRRCVPCAAAPPAGGWEAAGADREVGHACGMPGLHAMFASSVGDWSGCVAGGDNAALMERLGQTQAPTNVTAIHFFQDPTFLLQFNTLDMEAALFDMLLTYLPHWDKFLGAADGFPFNSVISHSLEGCLSHSHNWFCEVLHQMYAFGEETKEIPWEADDNTLYCYRELFYNQVGYQRNLDHEGLLTRENFGDFREMLFRKFGLPRRRTVADRLADLEYDRAQAAKNGEGPVDGGGNVTRIVLYDNKRSERTTWDRMESLVAQARGQEKYRNIKFVTVDQDFDSLTVAQQARTFNEADAVVTAHGQHLANAIFAVDGTAFVELGCRAKALIGNPRFMGLMDGRYRAVERCGKEAGDSAACVACKGEGEGDGRFTMSPAAFEQLIDDVVAGLEK